MRKPCDSITCRQRCQDRITHNQRQMLFNEYYALADTHKQWQYIAKRLGKVYPKYRDKKSMRNLNVRYNFMLNDKMVSVCKKMFLNTYNVSNIVCKTALSKCNDKGEIIENDKRGCHSKYKGVKE